MFTVQYEKYSSEWDLFQLVHTVVQARYNL